MLLATVLSVLILLVLIYSLARGDTDSLALKRWLVRGWRITLVPSGSTLYLPEPNKQIAVDWLFEVDSTVIFGPPPEPEPLPWRLPTSDTLTPAEVWLAFGGNPTSAETVDRNYVLGVLKSHAWSDELEWQREQAGQVQRHEDSDMTQGTDEEAPSQALLDYFSACMPSGIDVMGGETARAAELQHAMMLGRLRAALPHSITTELLAALHDLDKHCGLPGMAERIRRAARINSPQGVI